MVILWRDFEIKRALFSAARNQDCLAIIINAITLQQRDCDQLLTGDPQLFKVDGISTSEIERPAFEHLAVDIGVNSECDFILSPVIIYFEGI
jgi:hypothetical protein